MLTGFHYQLSPFQIADTSLYSNKMTHKSEEVLNEPPQNVSLWLGILSWGQLLRQKVPETSHYVSPWAAHSRSIVSASVTPWTAAHQTPLSMGILQTRLLEWAAMPSSKGPSQPRSPTLQADSLPAELPGKPHVSLYSILIHSIHSTYRSLFSFCFWLNCTLKTTAL